MKQQQIIETEAELVLPVPAITRPYRIGDLVITEMEDERIQWLEDIQERQERGEPQLEYMN